MQFSDLPPIPRNLQHRRPPPLKRKPLSPIADMVDYNGHASDDDYNPYQEVDGAVYM